ncbi:MAG: histidine--tRNA ligase, partial [Nitrospiraceae bacterium]|nr:histidine--tRNA ligase [Nitrospiraceae bacterium]
MAIRAVRGFKDILPEETGSWHRIEKFARGVFNSFGLREIRIPILEKTEVFSRGIGEYTDIVEKEMYSFSDRKGASLSLRPEATAGLLRAVNDHKLYAQSPVLKLFTMGPMFRHERPQKGRLRQFYQIDVEVLGTKAPLSDVEVIWMAWDIIGQLGIKNLQ